MFNRLLVFLFISSIVIFPKFLSPGFKRASENLRFRKPSGDTDSDEFISIGILVLFEKLKYVKFEVLFLGEDKSVFLFSSLIKL